MDKKAKNTMIVSVIALALVLIGVTYAYFSARITGLESASTISLTAGRMGIQYSEDDATVTANNIYPREEAWITKQITLTGWNTTDQEMKYDLGLNIESNTFKGGQLTFDLTGVGTNGTKIADITGKSITKTSGFFKFGTGIFLQSDGDTHVYTLKIYFKDNGKDQNMNQKAVFNAKIGVKEFNEGKHCYTDDYVEGQAPTEGKEYVNGQYTYKYNYSASGKTSWGSSPSQNGWGVMLTDKDSTDAVTTELCAYINEKPVVNMRYMFYESQATSLDLSSFDTSNVTDMSYMFSRSHATSLDLSPFDTSNVADMNNMFSETSSLMSVDLSNFDTSKVKSVYSLFYNSAVTNIDVSNFDTSNMENIGQMFFGVTIDRLILDNFDTSNVNRMNGLFDGANIGLLDISSFDTSKVTRMDSMFRNFRTNNPIDVSFFDTSNVTDMSRMFSGINVTSLDISSFDTSNVTNMSYMFYYCSNLITIYVSNKFITTSLAEDSSSPANGASNMFNSSTKLVGGAGTTYNSSKTNREYAHIDGGTSNPGYFTAK